MIKEFLTKNKNAAKIKTEFLQNLNFDYLSKFYLTFGLIKTDFSNAQKICVEFPNINTDTKKIDNLNDSFRNNSEFLIKTKTCEYEIDVNQTLNLFNEKSEKKYTQEEFTVVLKIFVSILNNFNDDLFRFNLEKDNILEKHSQFFSLKKKQSYQNLIDQIFEKDEKTSDEFENNDSSLTNLIFLLHVFTLFGSFTYTNLTTESLLKNVDLYLSFVTNDFLIASLLHFQISILIQLTIKKTSVETFLSTMKKHKNNLIVNEFVPTFFFIENDLTFNPINFCVNLKFFVIPYLIQPIDLRINLSILTFQTLRFIPSVYFKGIEVANNDDVILNIEDVIYLAQKVVSLDTFTLKLSQWYGGEDVIDRFDLYYNLIINSNSVAIETDTITENVQYQWDWYFTELDLLLKVMTFLVKFKKLKSANGKKGLNSSFMFYFDFNSFQIRAKKQVEQKGKHIRELLLILHHGYVKEEDFLKYITKKGNMIEYYNKLKSVISKLQNFKKFSTGVRLSKSETKNPELKFYLNLVYLQISQLLSDHAVYKNVVLFESEYISQSHTVVINDIFKAKEKGIYFSKYLKRMKTVYLQSLLKFFGEYKECFGLVVVHDEIENKYGFSPEVLLRNYDENILIIINNAYGKLNVLIYFSENKSSKDYHEMIFKMIDKIKAQNKSDIINEIIAVVRKSYLLGSQYFNSNEVIFSSKISKIYLIDNENKIDCYLGEKKIMLHYYGEKSNYFTDIINIINFYFEIINYVTQIKKYRSYNNLGIYFDDKIFYLKNGSFLVKQIDTKFFFHSFLFFSPLKGENSYPLFMLYSQANQESRITFEQVLDLYQKHFYPSINQTKREILNIFLEKIFPSIGKGLLPYIFDERAFNDFYETFLGLKNECKFDDLVFLPIQLAKLKVEKEKLREDFAVSRRVTLFQFINTKLNFFSKNDIGRTLSLGKITTTIKALTSNPEAKTLTENNESYIMPDFKKDVASLRMLCFMKKKFIITDSDSKEIILRIISYINQGHKKSDCKRSCEFKVIIADFYDIATEVNKRKKRKDSIEYILGNKGAKEEQGSQEQNDPEQNTQDSKSSKKKSKLINLPVKKVKEMLDQKNCSLI